jgi:membrane protein DedA with SNARE-associated domain
VRRAPWRRRARLFARQGASTVFIARLLPITRTFVSLPAGHVGVPLWRFVVLTIVGCAIWSAAFVLAGSFAGAGWHQIATGVGRVSLAFAAVALLIFVLTRGQCSSPR